MCLLILTSRDVEKISEAFDIEELESLMSKVFMTISNPDTPTIFSPPRTTIPTENHKVLFMPSRMPNTGTSIKVVSVPSSSAALNGLPATTMVLDEVSGAIKAIVNARSLTALRNAAGSLLSTRLVGPALPGAIVAFGAGKQIETHLNLHLRAYPSIRKCTIVNRSHNTRLSSLRDMLVSRHPSVTIECIGRAEGERSQIEQRVQECVEGASIIICATSSTIPLFPSLWVGRGTHIILIGSYTPKMREVDTELIHRAIGDSGAALSQSDRVLLVDSKEACTMEAGELIDAGVQGGSMVEIGQYIKLKAEGARIVRHDGGGEGDTRSGGVTIFKSVGVGMQDVAIACATVEKASSMAPRVGTIIEDYDI